VQTQSAATSSLLAFASLSSTVGAFAVQKRDQIVRDRVRCRQTAGYVRECSCCKKHKPIKGGIFIGGFQGRFKCADCKSN
jgi:hypothetical protein